MKIKKNIFNEIINRYSIVPPEEGGILGCDNEGIVCEYFHDEGTKHYLSAVYEPSIHKLNTQIQVWSNKDIRFAGIIHSHPLGQDTLSSGDKKYIRELYNNLIGWKEDLFFPIIIPDEKRICLFVARLNANDVIIQHDDLHIIE